MKFQIINIDLKNKLFISGDVYMLANLKKRISESYLEMAISAFFLLSFIFFNVFVSSFFFIFKVSIHKCFFLISFVLSIIATSIFLKKTNLKKRLVAIILSILIIIFSILLNGKIYDYTWDGNSYQKATTGMLAIGWNPLYEELEDFDDNSKEQINIGDESPIYINNYAKASNIFAANVYKFTGNIETGKSINTITIALLFLLTFSFLVYKKKSLLFTFLFSICVVSYPIVCTQFLTNYIDILVYAFLYLTIFSFFLFEEDDFVFSKRNSLFMFFMILTIAINIKFSLFGYVGIYCLVYYIWYVYRVIKGKMDTTFFKNFTYTAIVSVVVGVFVVGLSVYPKNLIDHGNPFYPLYGNDNVDIMTQNSPKEFKDKTPVQKFLISFFSKSSDLVETSNELIKLKIPFTMSKDELWSVGLPDVRLSGNGVWFSGIFIISSIIIVISFKDLYNKNSIESILFSLPMIVTTIMIFFLQEAWWARYFPQLYLFVLFALILLNENSDNKRIKVLQYVFIVALLINNFVSFQDAIKRSYKNNVICNVEFQKYESLEKPEDTNLVIYTKAFNGAKFNIIDKTKEENIVFINQYPNDKTDINTFFDGKVEWRYEYEEVR